MEKIKSTKNPDGIRHTAASETYNLTHLSPGKEFERYRFIHRDFVAHGFRWAHAAMILHKHPQREQAAVLDIGCGPEWPLLTCLHSNGCAPAYFVGIDARDCEKTRPNLKSTTTEFVACDITKTLPLGRGIPQESGFVAKQPWDMVVCFEVLEHMPKESGLLLLDNIKKILSPGALLLFSTPCFDEKVGMAENHIYEWRYEELKGELEKRFTISAHYGTFASMRDYKPLMTPEELKLMEKLKEYYNTALLACMMAPLYPHKARNVLWHLRSR